MKTLLIYNVSKENKDLSYQHGWVKAFKNDRLFRCDFLNLKNIFSVKSFKINIKNLFLTKYDCIVVLHSAFSNACLMPSYLQKIIRNKSSFKIYFIRNEYKHMPEKVSFIKYLKINLLITQSHSREVIESL